MPGIVGVLEPAARIIVATLFNSLWEAALLAFAVWLILRTLPNLNATTRYAAWCVALAASMLLPLATALPQISVQQSAARNAVRTAAAPVAVRNPELIKARAENTGTVPLAAPAARPSLRLPERLRFALPEYVALALFGAWLLAAVLLLVRLGVNLWRLERLKSDALPLPVDYRDRLARWSLAEKGGREVRLCVCDRIEVPVAVGLFDSMILIPQHLLDTLSQEDVDQIMLHELAHLRRADDWTNGLQRIVQALYFFNPAVLYIAQQLDLEREVACDDWVVDQTREVRPYATCLTRMAEVTAWPHRAMAAPGVFMTRRGLSVRVERLLRTGRNVRTSLAFGPAGGVVAALVVLFFLLQTVAPSFAFTLPQVAQATTPRVVVRTSSPSPSPSPKTIRKIVHMQTRVIDIPAQHIHIKARTQVIHTPAVDIDMPARHFVLPKVAVRMPAASGSMLPADFGKRIAQITSSSIGAAMNGVSFSGAAMRNANCVGCDFSGRNLAGHSFRGQRMNGANFSKSDLQNADFSNSVLLGADFSGANLRGASFENATLTGCDFSHADVTGVNFRGARVVGCDVEARSLSPSQASALIHACSTGCDFSGVNLQNQDLHGLSISGVDLSHADLRGANLSNVSFSGVDLSNARLDGARVDGATFTGCDLSGIDLHTLDFSKATVVGTKFGNHSEP